MAYFVLNYSFIVLVFYSNIFKSANPKTVNDSWLWPNELDSKIDERPLIEEQKLIYSLSADIDITRWQKRPGFVYQDSPLAVKAGLQTRRNSSAWKKLKIDTQRLSSLVKPTSSTNFGISKNLNPRTDENHTNTRPSSVAKDWSFPEENPVKRKAELKCAEYNKAIENKDVWIHPLVGNWPVTPSPMKTQNKCKGIKNPLIIGGTAARSGEFAHMAALGWISPDNKTSFLCGGSLISHQWVITAAHCTHGPSGSPKIVRIGTHHLGDKAGGKLIKIREIVRHPSYKPPAVYADLALLQLDKAINFGSQIKPACLYTEFDTTPNQGWATGWGVTGIGEEQSEELLKIHLDVVDNVVCALRLNRSAAIPRGIVPSMLCAGDVGGDWHRDTCQGDSGGPLQVPHPNHKCLHQIIGVTSFGRLCALRHSPGVYTRISHYLDWIESIVWPHNR